MKIITQNYQIDKMMNDSITTFSKKYGISKILKSCNAYKSKGFTVIHLFMYMLSLAFTNRSIYMNFLTGNHKEPFKKDTIYRFLNSQKINWIKFTSILAAKISNESIIPLTDNSRENVLIIDDTTFERPTAKKVELLSKVFDHSTQRYKRGFRLLTLGWSDGNTFLPIAGRLLASTNKKNIYQPAFKSIDKRTLGFKRRKQAQTKATEVMIDMLKQAKKAGIQANHVLFDTWFCSPSTILAVKDCDFDVVAMTKKSSKIHYLYQEKKQSVKDIYKSCKKRRGRSKYLLSVEITVEKDGNSTPAKLVFVRNRSKKKDWLVLISTDITLTENEIIKLYGKRWDIEVFFKVCKSYLKLGKECRSLSYDAMTAHVAIVFTRYMMLSLERRQNEDPRSLGELFYLTCDELADITFETALLIIMEILIQAIKDNLFLTKKQISKFLNAFVELLPKFIKTKLNISF